MRKLFFLPLCLLALTACNEGKKVDERIQHERDSLVQIIESKDAELNEIMGAINEVQEGFRQISEAEGRITVANGNPEATSSKETIRENIQFIQETMEQNRAKIAQLREKLKTTTVNVEKLTKTIENLQSQLEEQNKHVQELEAQLADRDETIAQQGATINDLTENVSNLQEESSARQQTIQQQEKELNTAWFVFGTKSELKEQKILQNGDVLRSGDFNKDYFTSIDIRVVKTIKLYSKNAKLMTAHPSGSYTLAKDANKEYVLQITNPTQFWSTSKYLVILVK
ncbi:MAG: hypothetical protein IKR98_03870 [Bacteroidaceae bacterium]|nr:hypothetical protein [Bacteroidaceae bacterium]